MELHSLIDVTQVCRVCLRITTDATNHDEPMVNIHATPSPNHPSLYGMLSVICASVFSTIDGAHDEAIEDPQGMPQNVCSDCTHRVVAAYELHERCVDTERKLVDMLTLQPEILGKGRAEAVPRLNQPDPVIEAAPDIEIEANNRENEPKTKNFSKKVAKLCLDDMVTPSDFTKKTCLICCKIMKSSHLLKKHMKKMHPSEIHSCDDCEDVFFSISNLADHKMYHATGRAHPCQICKKRFKTPVALRDHLRTHTDYAPFLCTVCGKGFNNNSNLRQHALRHSGQKTFTCEQCPSRFYTKGALKTHMLTHTKERRFACDTCGARFTMSHSLVKHSRIHTGERPYACDVCDQRFTSSDHAKRHMRTHTGEKPYKCNFCDRMFAQSNDLVKHSRSHLGDNPYQCDRCMASFRLLSELRSHYKVHFQPGDADANDAMQALDNRYSNHSGRTMDEIRFTSVSLLQRRFEQEKRHDRLHEKSTGNRINDREKIVAIPVDISKIPTVMNS